MDPAPDPLRRAVAELGRGAAHPLESSELAEHLLVAASDLDRLQRLLGDAGQALLTHFQAAATQMKLLRRELAARPDMNAQPLEVAMDHLSAAIATLQFQDVAGQLLEQAGDRLGRCAGRLRPVAAEPEAEAAHGLSSGFLDTIPLVAEPGLMAAPACSAEDPPLFATTSPARA
jgi:hypothetical protein